LRCARQSARSPPDRTARGSLFFLSLFLGPRIGLIVALAAGTSETKRAERIRNEERLRAAVRREIEAERERDGRR
jgi:hypothetical protein